MPGANAAPGINILRRFKIASVSVVLGLERTVLGDADRDPHRAEVAGARDADKKNVTLNFKGEGDRRVKVGYVVETPVWKTSYRLVIGEEKPLLQGWAIVENTTEEDWNEVALTLMSGRPISFVMDLYQPLYVERPEVKPELYSSLRPKTYDQDLALRDQEFDRRIYQNDLLGKYFLTHCFGGAEIRLKDVVDEAARHCPSVENVASRPGVRIASQPGTSLFAPADSSLVCTTWT